MSIPKVAQVIQLNQLEMLYGKHLVDESVERGIGNLRGGGGQLRDGRSRPG